MLSGTSGTLHHSSEDEPRVHAASPSPRIDRRRDDRADPSPARRTRRCRRPLTAPHQIRAALAAALEAQLSADEGRPVDVKEVC
ncbi:hypothetical protein NKH18_30005 [Streptomyces sp. M10(2022)]